MKHVLLLVIDALTSPLLQQEMDKGRYPHFQKLRERGVFREQCVSIFPSITHAALTSIITGQYPVDHGVVGSHWYDLSQDKVIYFSGSWQMVLQKGLGGFFREFLLDLNHDHLQTPTLFQQLERAGHETASINFPLYRGDETHEVNMPLLLKWIPNLPASTQVKGPRKLILGDLLANPHGWPIEATQTGISNWFGFRDNNTIDLILQLARTDAFPDFTLAYFPENDDRSHTDGPGKAHQELTALDEMLGDLFAAYGGLDPFAQQFMLVITGDHSQSETVADATDEAIDLEKLLSNYQLAEAGQPWQEGDDIMPCPNLRAGHLYFKKVTPAMVEGVVSQLLADRRIDQLMFRAALTGENDGFIVQTANGRLRFWPASEGKAHDRYGNTWGWDGDLSVVDGQREGDTLIFPEYPNAFERIAGVLDAAASGHLWVTAKVGHEIVVPLMKSYAGGGSHASLHRLDSQAPLFVIGAPGGLEIPLFPRIVDVAPLCYAALTKT